MLWKAPALAADEGLGKQARACQSRAMLKPLLALAALAAALPATAQTGAPSPADAAPGDWRAIPDDEILVMTLAGGHQAVIRLAPRYAPAHVANIRTLAEARWWDGTSIYRVQDNYVTQWGGGDDKTALPAGVIENPPAEYEWPGFDAVTSFTFAKPDSYAARTGISADGWPLANYGKTSSLTHCYAMVGVARDLAPSTGSGAELYTVIGHAPRPLDRNIALVGRVIEGMQWLSSLPRGTAPLGVYAPGEAHTAILSVRLASQLPADERPHFQYRAADNVRFAAWIKARENRDGAFFTVPMGGVDVCNAMPPVRRAQ
jgi:cyclophilin family peptidyl-prolyl cis-trans isomerase